MYDVLARSAMTTRVWIGCWHARDEVERRFEVIVRLSQLSLQPRERSCLGSKLEPLMLNGCKARCGTGP
jgi:hypothetical protein